MSFPAITSPGNERIKRAVRLRRGTHRREDGLTLVDGARELAAALAAGVTVRQVYFCRSEASFESLATLLAEAAEQRAEVFEVSEAVAGRLAYGERRDGVWGVVVPPQRGLDDLELRAQPLVAVLEGVEKPGNVGAVVRSADAAGASAVIVADGGTDLFNPNTIRASLGTIFHVPVCAAACADVGAWTREKHLQLVAARLDGEATPWDIDLTKPTALLLGAESTGLSDAWNQAEVQAVRLPMQGIADSLNVSATAAVLFYEALRQRMKSS